MKAPKHWPLVMVHWYDACHFPQELAHSELGELYELWEVGFLIVDGKDSVVLCMESDKAGTKSSRGTLTIPRVNIVEIAPVCLKPKKKVKTSLKEQPAIKENGHLL